MGIPDLLLLGCSDGRPYLNVMNLATGEVAPSPVSVDHGQTPPSECLLRQGWLAVSAHQDLWGVRLPMHGKPFYAGESFGIRPGLDPRTVWLQPRLTEHGGWQACVEYDGVDGTVRREVGLPSEVRLEAATPAGFVGADETDDCLRLYDEVGRPGDEICASDRVLAAHRALLVCAEDRVTGAELRLVDVEAASTRVVECPVGCMFELMTMRFSPDGSVLAVVVDVTEPDPEHEAFLERFAAEWPAVEAMGLDILKKMAEIDRRAPGWQEHTQPRPKVQRLAVVRCADGARTVVEGQFAGYVPELVWSADRRWLAFEAFDEASLLLWEVGAPSLTSVEHAARVPTPLIDVSDSTVFGNLRIERLRALQRPPWRGPIPESDREQLLHRSCQQLEAAAADAGLPDEALADCEPAVRLRSVPPGSRIPVGASRLGGRPDLPSGHKWPKRHGLPMAFLAQLRLDELDAALPSAALPTDGLLLVFVATDPELTLSVEDDNAHIEVVSAHGLRRRLWPAKLPPGNRYEPALAIAEPMISVPDRSSLEKFAPKEVAEQFLDGIAPPGPLHQFLGHPSTIQGHPAPGGDRQLLQLDGDSIVRATYGDCGRLHFWVPRESPLDGVIAGCTAELDCY